jgi:transcriptional regulator with XRE-family HTH domain
MNRKAKPLTKEATMLQSTLQAVRPLSCNSRQSARVDRSVQNPAHLMDMYVGERIRYFRNLAGISQQQIAKKCGITFQQFQKYENAHNRISAGRLYQVAVILNAPVSAFFPDGSPKEQNKSSAALTYRRDSLELLRSYNSIADETLKRKAYELIKNIAAIQNKGASS